MSHAGASMRDIERVYRRRGADFFRFAQARTSDSELAMDAVQEGFARAIRARRSYAGTGALEAWIARCVLTAAVDALQTPVADALAEESISASATDSPDADVKAAIRDLPPRQRDALFLRHYLDLDYISIAGLLNIEVGTVSATLHAARDNLTRTLVEVTHDKVRSGHS